jgi:hypothetical protein
MMTEAEHQPTVDASRTTQSTQGPIVHEARWIEVRDVCSLLGMAGLVLLTLHGFGIEPPLRISAIVDTRFAAL